MVTTAITLLKEVSCHLGYDTAHIHAHWYMHTLCKSAPPIKGDQVLFQPFCGLFHSATTPYAFLRRCGSCNATLPPRRVPIRATVLAVECCYSQEPLTRSAQMKQNVRLPSSMCFASHLKQARANSSRGSSSSSFPFLQDTSDAEWLPDEAITQK